MKVKKIVVLAFAMALVLSSGIFAADLSPEVAKVLDAKIVKIKELVAKKAVVDAVAAANIKDADLTDAKIAELDKAWIASKTVTAQIKPYLTNKCAMVLMDFQETNPGYPEMFVTDKKGLIVAETNKTSDYLQADEDWWKQTYNEGKGADVKGKVEFDESAKAEIIAISVPVKSEGKVIGVIKAAVDITAIKSDLK